MLWCRSGCKDKSRKTEMDCPEIGMDTSKDRSQLPRSSGVCIYLYGHIVETCKVVHWRTSIGLQQWSIESCLVSRWSSLRPGFSGK